MLKDITLGQYFPGNSLAHRLDPRTKLILTVVYIVALFCAAYFVSYALVIALLALSVKVSGVAPRAARMCSAPTNSRVSLIMEEAPRSTFHTLTQ